MQYQGQVTENESLKKLNSWHVGGCADRTFRPKDLNDLSQFLKTLPPDEPITYLGLGSNVLIRDAGIRGTVILTLGALNTLRIEEGLVYAEAGITCAKLAKLCAKENLDGGAFFAGIPGTVGGALAMNAGAFGGVTWDVVESADVIDRSGAIKTIRPGDIQVAYRHVDRPEGTWFVAGRFKFSPSDAATQSQDIKALLQKRSDTQPIGLPSCGSVFRNPEGGHAAQLIESCGLKGLRIGGAEVSMKHANFIINTGDATSADIEQLIAHVQATVLEKTGIHLIREVHIIGEEV